jgi:hypothetical protein
MDASTSQQQQFDSLVDDLLAELSDPVTRGWLKSEEEGTLRAHILVAIDARQLSTFIAESTKKCSRESLTPSDVEIVRRDLARRVDERVEYYANLHFQEEQRAESMLQFKQKAGRWTLEEAASVLGSKTGGTRRFLTLLKDAIHKKDLIAYQPGGLLKIEIDPKTQSRKMVGKHLEVYWDDLNCWLETHERRIAYRFPKPDTGTGPEATAEALANEAAASAHVAKPLPRQRYQEQEILRMLRNIGFDPMAIPKKGAKAAARKKLNFTKSTFEKAWERLRKSGELQDAKDTALV